jgi:hypothetical protein
MAKNIAPAPAAGSVPASTNPINTSGVPKQGKLIKKGHSKSVDPYAGPAGPAYVYAPKERSGAAYGVQVGFEAHVAPEATSTQANGRIVNHAINRSAPNFSVGMQPQQ